VALAFAFEEAVLPQAAAPGQTSAFWLGRLALTGLVLNSVIGSSVFGLPSVVAARLGAMSVWAWLVAALGMAFVIACFAEVASRFREAGGAYLYARATFGRLAGGAQGQHRRDPRPRRPSDPEPLRPGDRP